MIKIPTELLPGEGPTSKNDAILNRGERKLLWTLLWDHLSSSWDSHSWCHYPLNSTAFKKYPAHDLEDTSIQIIQVSLPAPGLRLHRVLEKSKKSPPRHSNALSIGLWTGKILLQVNGKQATRCKEAISEMHAESTKAVHLCPDLWNLSASLLPHFIWI